MIINIEDKALEYIKEMGGYATIRYSKKGWCHSGDIDVPTIHLGKPESNLEDYEKYQEKEIILYFPKNLILSGEEIKVSLSKLFLWKKLTLEGALIKK